MTNTTQAGPQGATTGQAGQASGGAQDKAREAAAQAQEKAQQAAGQARGQVRDQVDQRSTQAGERVGTVAEDARSVSQTLREQGKEQPAKIVDQVADRAESLGDYLRNADGDRILHDVEDFGRSQPWAVIGGGLLLGIVASRFLKASSTRRYETRSSDSSPYPIRSRYSASSGRAQAPAYRPGSDRLVTPPVSPGLRESPLDAPDLREPRDPGLVPPPRDTSLPDGPPRDPDFR